MSDERKLILISDDDLEIRNIVRRALSIIEDCDIIEAKDGEEALEKASKERPDLSLMDMQLPLLDGYEATRRIKADKSLAQIPVIALTAYAMKGDREKTMEAGCSDYIEKPIDPATFVAQVEKILVTQIRIR